MSSVRDILVISIILFAVGVVVFFSVNIGHRVNDALVVNPSINASAPASNVIIKADSALNMSDYLYLGLFIAFFLSVLITGWFIGGYPIMAPVYFFIVIFFVFVAIILQLVFIDVADSSALLATQSALPITYFILSRLGYFMAVTGLLGIFAMYAKPGGSDGIF